MWHRPRLTKRSYSAGPLFAAFFVGATVLTFWLGYNATREWDENTELSVQTRGRELLALLTEALERDMTGAQLAMLLSVNQPLLDRSSTYDLADRFAGGFARFPYVESVFVWKYSDGPEGVCFFNRAERAPLWDATDTEGEVYPVVVRQNPQAVRPLISLVRSQAAGGAPLALIETTIGDTRYQTVAQLLYEGRPPRLASIVGFTVNLEWVRQHYFQDLMHQIARISENETIRLEVVDEMGQTVAETVPAGSGVAAQARSFPMAFAHRSILSAASASLHVKSWAARVDVSTDATLMAARRGTTRTLGLLALGAVGAIGGLILTVRTSRAAVGLATRQSEFVSAVSHEMKAPLSLITLASDSLANGRYTSPETIGQYGRLLAAESRQLTRLIDNVLCYARVLDAPESYSFEAVDITELIEECVERFRLRFAEVGCDVQIDSPSLVPPIRGDRTMLRDVLDNVVDNALKYGGGRHVAIRVSANGRTVAVNISDRGDGIPPAEVSRVFDKFYRVKGTKQRGSGLGLTIARKIVEEHQGTIDLRTEVGRGTSVTIELPYHARS